MLSENAKKWYQKNDLDLPSHEEHGSSLDLEKKLKRLKPYKWEQKGNHLIGYTDMGKFVQPIPPSHILTGQDENGMPTFEKIKLQYIIKLQESTEPTSS